MCFRKYRAAMQPGDENHHPPTRDGDGAWWANEAGIFREPMAWLETEISCAPCARVRHRLGGRCVHNSHEVSEIIGAGKHAQAAAVRSLTRINRPVWQTGHGRDNRSSRAESGGESALASMAIGEAGIKERQSASFSFRLQLARNPKWRI